MSKSEKWFGDEEDVRRKIEKYLKETRGESNDAREKLKKKLFDYLNGYTKKPSAELPEPKKGDPQRSALMQYVIDKFGLPNKNIEELTVVDFGSGNGTLAYELENFFTDKAKVPNYIAVDLPECLDKLFLPKRIHNRSKKIAVDEFYSDFLPKYGNTISVVVLRNVLHELYISDTANLFYQLNKYISKPTDLYVQDMTTLPEHERGNAGWAPELLGEFMSDIGIESSFGPQVSHGGTEWFILKANLPGTVTDLDQIEEKCAYHRQKQHDNLLEEACELQKEVDEESAVRLIQLQGDITSISVQLMGWKRDSGIESQQASCLAEFPSMGIYIRTEELGSHDFCIKIEDDIFKKTGQLALLSSKSIIDFPKLYRSCTRGLLFSGYSLKSFFSKDENYLAIQSLLQNGIPVSILLVDPDSEAAKTRSKMPSYSNPDKFIAQIHETIEAAKSLNAQLLAESDGIKSNLEVRLTHRPPSCSYFFADNLCFLSLYSHRGTGSRGQCFVYSSNDGALGSYYHFLLEDFQSEWDKAARIAND